VFGLGLVDALLGGDDLVVNRLDGADEDGLGVLQRVGRGGLAFARASRAAVALTGEPVVGTLVMADLL